MSEITFRLKKKDYEIPDFMSIDNYVKIFKIKDLFEDEYMKAKVINLVTDCPMDDLVNEENHKVEFLAKSIFDLLPRIDTPLIDRFEIDGIHYGYIPSYKELTFAEFADLDTLLTKKPEEMMDYLHIITAIMYRPIISEKSRHNFKIEKYNQDTLNDRAELFKKKLDIKYTLGGQFFFINFARMSSSFTRPSLKEIILREWNLTKFFWHNRKLIWRTLLRKDLDGSLSSIESQVIISSAILKYLTRKY